MDDSFSVESKTNIASKILNTFLATFFRRYKISALLRRSKGNILLNIDNLFDKMGTKRCQI